MVRRVRDFEMQFITLSDERIKSVMNHIRRLLRDGAEPDEHLPKIFGAVCVATKRVIGLRPFDVQIVGGYEMHRGSIAEMGTGEGKTLVATLPATLNAVGGRGVHIVTVNDYLAQRDAQIMGPIYNMLGLTVGTIISGMDDTARRAAYRCDIIYGTNKEFGFDYLRDQIKLHERQKPKTLDTLNLLNRAQSYEPVMRQLHYAIVDEADSILIDESRTPLVIAGPSGPSPLAWAYEWAHQLAGRFRARHDFEVKTDKRILTWKDEGRARLEKVLQQTTTPSIGGQSWQDLVLAALKARWLFTRDQHYVIAGDQVVIVDEFTGRRMPGRTWSEGLHQAVQAKERLPIMAPSKTLARTTYQHFFSLYGKLAGMTGTATTERAEFKTVYSLPVVRIPTHRPVKRIGLPDRIYRTTREKWRGVADEIQRVGDEGRPVLVGTHSIEDSEALSRVLKQRGIKHETLNARPENAQREAEIVANAGQINAVTIATNMAGRGTDIKLGPGVTMLGGLHVIGTQRHESRRVDRQLIGRCGRQGDPGSYIFVLSLQDSILQHVLDRRQIAMLRRKLKTPYGKSIATGQLRRYFALAQLRVEKMHFRMRQQLMEYEDWLNKVYHQMGAGS